MKDKTMKQESINNETDKRTKYVFKGGGFKNVTTVVEHKEYVQIVSESNAHSIPNPIPSVIVAYRKHTANIYSALRKYDTTDIPFVTTYIINGKVVMQGKIDGNLTKPDSRLKFRTSVNSLEEALAVCSFVNNVKNEKI